MIKYKNSSQHTTPHTGGATKASVVARRHRPVTVVMTDSYLSLIPLVEPSTSIPNQGNCYNPILTIFILIIIIIILFTEKNKKTDGKIIIIMMEKQ